MARSLFSVHYGICKREGGTRRQCYKYAKSVVDCVPPKPTRKRKRKKAKTGKKKRR